MGSCYYSSTIGVALATSQYKTRQLIYSQKQSQRSRLWIASQRPYAKAATIYGNILKTVAVLCFWLNWSTKACWFFYEWVRYGLRRTFRARKNRWAGFSRTWENGGHSSVRSLCTYYPLAKTATAVYKRILEARESLLAVEDALT